MKDKSTTLLEHLIKSGAPTTVWEEYFNISPPTEKLWLSGEKPSLMELAGSFNITPYLVDRLTQALGGEVWARNISGSTPLKSMLLVYRKANHLSYSQTIREAVELALGSCPIEQGWDQVREFLHENQKQAGLKSINILPWAGRPSEYWTGHPLEIPATLIACQLPSAVLRINNSHWDHAQDDGTNLAYLFMHDELSFQAWVGSGRSMDEPVYIDTNGEKSTTPIPMYRWMAEKGNLYKGISRRVKAEGGDIAFEEQLKGKAWRSAIGRRKQWRQWTGSSGKNALHIVARHHAASFLTSQARVNANHKLLGDIDTNGDGCANHLIIGMLASIPERRRSYWSNALSQFSSTMKLIEDEVEKKNLGEKPRGLIPALVQTDKLKDPVPSNWKEMLSSGGVVGWLIENPERLWEGMDRDCAIGMIQNYTHVKKFSRFIYAIISRELTESPSEELMNTSPESRMVLLAMMLSNLGSYTSEGARRNEKLIKLFNDTMSEEMDLPDHAMETYKNILHIQERSTIKDSGHDYVEAIKKKFMSIKLFRVAKEKASYLSHHHDPPKHMKM